MSEEKQLKFGEKLKTDKKFRFEFIIGIWTGLISVMLVVAVVFVGRAYMAGTDTPTESVEEVVDDSPVLVSEPAIDADEAEETKEPYQSAIINHNEEDFMDGGEDDSEDLKTADTAYATTVVNLRKDPALTAPVIGKLQPGDKVSILKYDKEWTHVSVDGMEGYVSTIYLSTRRPAEGPSASNLTTPKPSTTNPPKTTPKPTKKPRTTKPPKTTQKPRVTKEPESTKEPEQTKAPEPTKAPEATKAPEPTKAPEATKDPDTSENAE